MMFLEVEDEDDGLERLETKDGEYDGLELEEEQDAGLDRFDRKDEDEDIKMEADGLDVEEEDGCLETEVKDGGLMEQTTAA